MIFRTLEFTDQFLESLLGNEFSRQERRLFLKALRLLDSDERHPSLRVHQFQGELDGVWSASASDALRIMFLRTEAGHKQLLDCSRHYR